MVFFILKAVHLHIFIEIRLQLLIIPAPVKLTSLSETKIDYPIALA